MSRKSESHDAASEQSCLRQIRRLTQALVVSGAANILLLAFILYGFFGNGILLMREALEPRLWSQSEVESSNRSTREVLLSFQGLPLEQLIARLDDARLVENGYSERDLALGYLVWRHKFNLTKALNGQELASVRHLPIHSAGQVTQLPLYPGLSQKQYDAITQYAKTERWPLTSEGLYQNLKRDPGPSDSSLVDAFLLTPEFLTIQRLFARSDLPIEKSELLALLLEGNWTTIAEYSSQLQASAEPSSAERSAFLKEYLKRGSRRAASLLVKSEGAKRLDDPTALLVLQLLGDNNPEAQAFARELLNSPRSDAIWQAASRVSGVAIAQAPPSIPVAAPVAIAPANKATSAPPAKATAGKVYVVKNGDSLWKIAKNFKVDVAKLKAYNKLASDIVRPGASLSIQ